MTTFLCIDDENHAYFGSSILDCAKDLSNDANLKVSTVLANYRFYRVEELNIKIDYNLRIEATSTLLPAEIVQIEEEKV